jgi:hypothetical protein
MMRVACYALLLLISLPGLLFGQSESTPTNADRLSLTLFLPNSVTGLDESQREKLQTVLTELLTQQGVAAGSLPGSLVVKPLLRIVNEQTVNPGLQTLTVVESELSLTLQQADNNTIFSTVSKRMRGSGRTRELAINNLLNQINATDSVLLDFLTVGKQKALAYYNRECPAILNRVAQLTRINQFASAFGLLLSVPEGTDCYERVQSQTVVTFRLYQQQTCRQLLQQARSRLATRDFVGSLAIVEQIDPQSPCAIDTRQLIEQATRETSGDNQNQWGILKSTFADYRDLERYRMRIMSELAVRYYRTLPSYR